MSYPSETPRGWRFDWGAIVMLAMLVLTACILYWSINADR